MWIAKLGGTKWDLAPDGKRVAVLTPVESEVPKQDHEVVFLQNFFDEPRRPCLRANDVALRVAFR